MDRNAYRVEVGDGFLFRRRYAVELEDMDRYGAGMLVVKVTADELMERIARAVVRTALPDLPR